MTGALIVAVLFTLTGLAHLFTPADAYKGMHTE
jgi:hypothetical protein